jgi:predicted nucleic acid-binding protein
MIKLHPTKIEAYDDYNSLIFIVTSLDECCCTVDMRSPLSEHNIEEITMALKTAVEMLKLESA